jgi:hypothetical protein
VFANCLFDDAPGDFHEITFLLRYLCHGYMIS